MKYQITLTTPSVSLSILKSIIKHLGRKFGLKCIHIEPQDETP